MPKMTAPVGGGERRRLDPAERPRRKWRYAVAAALAACVVAAGVSRVAVGFTPARERLIRTPTAPGPDGRVLAIVPSSPQPLSVIVVRIARVGRWGPEPSGSQHSIQVRADGRLLASFDVGGAAGRRLDVQVPAALSPGARLELSCPAGWSVTYLELANLHGFSTGIFNAFIVPASRRDYAALAWWLAALLGVVLFAARLRAASFEASDADRQIRATRARSKTGVMLERTLLALGLLAFALVLLAPLVSPYKVVLSVPTFLLCIALVYGGPLVRRYTELRSRVAASNCSAAAAVDGLLAGLLIVAFFFAALNYGLRASTGCEEFLHVSDRFVRAPVLDPYPDLRRALKAQPLGYDGQFMFLMAFDPLLARFEPARYRDVVDSPPYRYGRIGFSLLTRVLSGGSPQRFAGTMMWLIIAGHALAALSLVMIARARGASALSVLPYVLIPGFLVALANALPESIAAGLLLGGLWSYWRWRSCWWDQASAGFLAAAWMYFVLTVVLWGSSLLVRETGIVLIVAVVGWDVVARTGWANGAAVVSRPEGRDLRVESGRERGASNRERVEPTGRPVESTRRRVAGLAPLVALVPIVVWRAYVGWRLAPAFGWRAFWDDPADFTVPFAGFLRLWSVNDAAHGHGQLFNVLFPLLLVALLALALWLFRVRRDPIALAAVGYSLMAVSLDYSKIWSWLGNGERGTFEAFLLVLVAALPLRDLPRPLRGALAAFGIALFVYDFQFGTHTRWFRSALMLFG